MIRITYSISATFLLHLCSPALACDLGDFDRSEPRAEGDQTTPTNRTHFNWGSDLDPWGNNSPGSKAQHFVENVHSERLSFHWPKAGLLVPFNNPITTSLCRDSVEFGNLGAFILDYDAPINTSNDGSKGAVAYVRTEQSTSVDGPRITGAQIRASYLTEDGEQANSTTRLVAYFYPEDQFLQLDVFSGEGGSSMAFRPASFGLDVEQVAGQLSEFGIEGIQSVSIDELVELDDFSSAAFENVEGDNFTRISVPEQLSLAFSNVTDIPEGETSVLLFSPQGSLLAAKQIATWPLLDAN